MSTNQGFDLRVDAPRPYLHSVDADRWFGRAPAPALHPCCALECSCRFTINTLVLFAGCSLPSSERCSSFASSGETLSEDQNPCFRRRPSG